MGSRNFATVAFFKNFQKEKFQNEKRNKEEEE